MQNVLFFVDRLSSWVGQAFSWLIVALTFLVSWEVLARYVLNTPNPWAFDLMIMMYGAAFMMAGAKERSAFLRGLPVAKAVA